jgi:SAM-dependent methyltransferase
MARRFPHASVLGVDLAPPPVDTGNFPPNLRFEIDDINLGLDHFYDRYDLVHARCVSGGINDMDKTIVEFQKCLKPGGLLIIMEGDHIYERRDKLARLKKLPGDPDVSALSENGSYLRRMVAGELNISWIGKLSPFLTEALLVSFDVLVEVVEAGTLAGSCINRAGELIDWGLWDYPLIDPDTCRSGGFYLPIGPWARGT